jgi:DNA sulfur modification protein DndE
MADKLKLSAQSSEKLVFLSNKLNLRRNVICRMAIGWSLAQKEPIETTISEDSNGFEFNKPTVLGSDEFIFASLSAVQNNMSIKDSIFFNVIIRNHIQRGLDGMYTIYQRTNSPVGFIEKMLSVEGQTD